MTQRLGHALGLAAVLALVGLYAAILRGYAQPAPAVVVQARAPSALEAALLESLRLPHVRPDGTRAYIAHCRLAREGCEERMRRIAALLELKGQQYRVDPWLLAAIMLRESGGNPDARGDVGELGLMQLHPRSPWGREALRECTRAPRDCDSIVIDGAARLLGAAIERCGSEADALGLYNTGRCGETSYSRAVLARRDALRRRSS
jgi:hypothetical protein